MNDKIKQLAERRQALALTQRTEAEARAQLEAIPEYREIVALSETCDAIRAEVAALEAEIREAAVAEFAASGNKKPWPGVGIREVTRLSYDPAVAREWCLTQAPALLMIDKRQFEKVAPSLPGAPVEVTKEAQATIATDLGEYLAGDA